MSLQEDLRKISEWSNSWEMSFNTNKCHVLQVGTKNLGVTVVSSLKFPQQCKEAVGKANRMLGFINRNFSFENKDVILPLYISFSETSSGIRRAILVASPCKGNT